MVTNPFQASICEPVIRPSRRAVTTSEGLPIVRASMQIGRVAELFDCDESQVRNLLDSGQIEGHRLGKRGVRIYSDSVIRYQELGARAVTAPKSADKCAKRPGAIARAAHDAAMRNLRNDGIVR